MSSLVCAVADTGIANGYGSQADGWYSTTQAQDLLRPDVSTYGNISYAKLQVRSCVVTRSIAEGDSS